MEIIKPQLSCPRVAQASLDKEVQFGCEAQDVESAGHDTPDCSDVRR
jgi:hypothetical protein